MSGSPTPNWTNIVTKAAFTLLLVAVVAYVVQLILVPLAGAIVILLALIAIYRIALGWFRRDGW
jgi:hypothetical protein